LTARRSLVAAKKVSKGSIFQNEDIIAKRPAKGINPMLINSVIGTKAVKDFEIDDLIEV
jgi:N,N'-diacetyllegionaminate synthase